MKSVISTARLIKYIKRNPGLTATQYTHLLRPFNKTIYTPASMITRLNRLCTKGLIYRRKEMAAVGNKRMAWRFYA